MNGAADWLLRARAAADQPPAQPREPLHLDVEGHPVHVGSIEPATAERMAAADLPLRRMHTCPGWRIAAPVGPSLAAIAVWLRDAGLAGRWRDERLAVVDGDGRALAEVERSVVRVLGLSTFAVHLVGYASDGARIWVQQRAFDKATDPGRWDTLMGGQMALGESIEATLERETEEEAGLVLADLADLRRGPDVTVRRAVPEGWMDERIAVFRAVLRDDVVPTNRDGEVVRFDCLDEPALRARLAGGAFTLEATLILGAELEPRGRAGR